MNRQIYYYHADRSVSFHRGGRNWGYERVTTSSRLRLVETVNKLAEAGRVEIRLSLSGWAVFEVSNDSKA